MKHWFKYFFLFVLIVFIQSCELSGPKSTLWFYTHSTGDVLEEPLKPSHFLYLMEDGTYTCDFGTFEHGKWDRKGENITLTNTNRQINVLSVLNDSRKLLEVEMKGVIANFESQPAFFNEIEDPFSLANNQWRIPAGERETGEQIRDRLINHCKFWEAYFTWGDAQGLKTLDVRSTPTPIKIYGNGVGLKPYDELPKEWCSYFYDTTDCYRATDILRDVFRKNDIDWAKSDNKYKIFLSAFQQVKGYLRKVPIVDRLKQ